MGRGTRTGEYHNGLNASLFREGTSRVANSMCLVKPLNLRLKSYEFATFCLQRDTHHHPYSLNWISANSCFTAKHNGICTIQDRISYVTSLRSCWARVSNHRLEHLCGRDHR